MSYNSLKQWCKDHKVQIYLVIGFVVIFFVGVGVGKWDGPAASSRPSNYQNYTTKTNPVEAPATQAAPAEGEVQAPTPSVPPQATTVATPCTVKGNISSKEKIYHVAGGAFYDRVKEEQCFETETAAQAAGYRKSSR